MRFKSAVNRRKRRRRLEDCQLPCTHFVATGAVGSISLWLWLLHRAISYDPAIPEAHKVPSNLLPSPIFPVDVTNTMVLSQTLANTPCHSKAPLTLTWQSNQHPQNQDRAFHYPSFPNNQLSRDEPSFLVGMFDGHGRDGHIMAAFVVKHFATVLVQKLNSRTCCQSDDWIKSVLSESFIEMENLAVKEARTRDFAFTGGCTASVTLRLGDRLFVANAGDSRTMLASDFEVTGNKGDPYRSTIRFTSRMDKADLPEEKARIEALGGKSHIPPSEKRLTSRVVLYSTHSKDSVGLAMSRSLGDHEWTAVGVIPEPLVDTIRLDTDGGDRPYLIVASDGLWDCRARRPQFFAKQIGAILFNDINTSVSQATAELVELIKQITPQQPQWYHDDITLIAFPL